MCLGVPMQVRAISGLTARCVARGIERAVSLYLLQDQPIAVGDYVLVHVGYAIQRVGGVQARSAWEAYDAMVDARGDAGA